MIQILSWFYAERVTSVINLNTNTYITDGLIKIDDLNITFTLKICIQTYIVTDRCRFVCFKNLHDIEYSIDQQRSSDM